MKVVSIVCPLYNKRNYIEETISSVIAQTSEGWELIIVDDGSTDGSFDIATAIAEKDTRIKVFKRSSIDNIEKGANVCRNIGIEKSAGDFVLFLDADDLLLPHCVAQRLEQVHQHAEYDLYVFNVAYCKGEKAKPFAKQRPSSSEAADFQRATDKRKYFLRRFLKFDLPWHTSGPLWRKSFLKEQGGFNPKFQRLQDPEFHTRILLNEKVRVAYLRNTTLFDILHRTDEDRKVWSKEGFLSRQLHGIGFYIQTFFPLISNSSSLDPNDIKLLQGYLLEAEKINFQISRNGRNRRQKSLNLKELYKIEEVNSIIDWKFRLFKAIFNIFANGLKESFVSTKMISLYKRMI